jgi:hypothetical protein
MIAGLTTLAAHRNAHLFSQNTAFLHDQDPEQTFEQPDSEITVCG